MIIPGPQNEPILELQRAPRSPGRPRRSPVSKTVGVQVPKRVTVRDLCERWLDFAEKAGKHPSQRYILAGPIRELGHYTPEDLVAGGSGLLLDYRVTRAGEVANGSVRRELGMLQTVLRWAARSNLITADQIPSFIGVLPPEGAPRDKFMTRDQKDFFWSKAHLTAPPDVALFTTIGLETAARRGAILDLTWDRVDLNMNLIDFRVPGQAVSRKRRVIVPISNRLRPVLVDHRLNIVGPAVGPLFPGKIGFDQRFRKFARDIGMEWVTPHVLRHTWGSLAAMAGVPLYDIAQVMGDTIATVERTYLHLTPGHLHRAVNYEEGNN